MRTASATASSAGTASAPWRIGADSARPSWIPDLGRLALEHAWDEPVLVRPSAWTLPAGAFGDGSGPS
jgi:hypothetical protein